MSHTTMNIICLKIMIMFINMQMNIIMVWHPFPKLVNLIFMA